MVINTNTHALAAATNLQTSQSMLSKSLARLSSGSKIINPADDAAGLAVSSRLDAQIKRTEAAKSNVGSAISFTQVQDGFLKKVAKALDRMSELSILALDITKSNDDRALYNQEFQQIAEYVTNTATKEFNGVSLFSGDAMDITIDSDGGTFTMTGINLSAQVYSDATNGNISTTAGATNALDLVKKAITQLASHRATIGAFQSRLEYTAEQLTISKENLTSASSRIQDVDVAEEATAYAKNNILVQSGTAMLAQANQLPQSVLRLLQ